MTTTVIAMSSRAAAESAPYPPLGRAAYVIGVLFVVTLLAQLDRQLPALLVSPLRRELHISDTAFSLLHGYAFAIAFAAGGLPFGQLVDRSNRRNIICVGVLFWSAATAVFAVGTSYDALLVARVGVGIAEAGLAPAAYSLLMDLVPPRQRGRALAAYAVSIAIGSGASLLLGGWLLAAIPPQGLLVTGFGTLAAWRVAFLAAAAPGVPLALLLMATVREPARQLDGLAPPNGRAKPSRVEFMGYLRRHPGAFARLLLYPTVLAVMGYGALSWAPTFFERIHRIPPAQSGVVLGVLVAVAGGFGTLAGGFLSDGLVARGIPAARLRVALIGLAIAGLPAVLWPLVPGPVLAFCLLSLTVLGIGLAQSAVPTSIQSAFPNRLRGKAIAAYALLASLLGIGLGPTAVALIVDRGFRDESAVGYAIAVTAAPSALLGLWLIVTGLRPYAAVQALVDAGAV
jgi:MFS family permease